jgi:di/tricarboxylate transporter
MLFDPLVVTLIVLSAIIVALGVASIAPEVTLLTGLLILVVCNVVKLDVALAGFANTGVLTIAALYVVGAGLRSTGGLETLSLWMLGRPTQKTPLIRLLGPVAGLSAFMNNTPLVAFMLPVFVQIAKRLRISPSRLLIPLSYATILGGCCTLIGTSTNLVVAGMIKSHGLKEMHLFELTWVGLPIALCGLTYLVTIGQRLLPDRQDLLEHIEKNPREYVVEMVIREGCPLIGQAVRQAGLRDLPGLYLYRIERSGQVISPVEPDQRMEAADLLHFSGIASTVVDLQKIRGLEPVDYHAPQGDSSPDIPNSILSEPGLSLASLEGVPMPSESAPEQPKKGRRVLCEVVISSTSPLLGQSIRGANFRSHYNASVIAVHRSGEKLQQKIGRVVLCVGDTLLMEVEEDFPRRWRHSPDFILVSGVEDSTPVAHERAWVALTIFGCVMLGMSFYPGDPVLPSMIGAVLMVLSGCVRAQEGERNIELSVILLVGAALGIGKGLESSGAAKLIAEGLLSFTQPFGYVAVLATVYLLTMLLSELLSNNACAAMMGSLAFAIAKAMDIDPRPLMIAVAIASSCAFATPIGYQTNLMVLNPGGYRFADYVRVGLPLNILCMIVAVILIPLVYR